MSKEDMAYRCGEYRDIFDASETDKMVGEEVVAYSQSLQKLRAAKAGIRYARQEALEEGRVQGRAEELKRVVLNLMSIGVSVDMISRVAGLSREQITEMDITQPQQ